MLGAIDIGHDINIDDIEFMDFETGDDDPDSEDDDPPSGLGLNGFINSIKGGKKLRKRMRKIKRRRRRIK